MEYIYAALLLHKAQKEINEANVKKVLEAAGIKADEAKVKALVSALEEVDIEEAISKTPAVAAAPAAVTEAQPAEEKKEEEKKEEKEEKKEEEAAAGLSALFG